MLAKHCCEFATDVPPDRRTSGVVLRVRVATRVDTSVLAVSSCLLRPPSSYIVLSLVPSNAAACGRAAPGEPLELHDLEHCSDYDAALLRDECGTCTALCAAAGSEGAVLAGFCDGPAAAAARAGLVALADALAPDLHMAAAPVAANIKLLLLPQPAKPARPGGDATAAESPPHAEVEPDAPAAGSPVQGAGRRPGGRQQRAFDAPAGGGAARARDATDGLVAGRAGGRDSALLAPDFQKPALGRAFLAWQGVQLRPVRRLRAAATS